MAFLACIALSISFSARENSAFYLRVTATLYMASDLPAPVSLPFFAYDTTLAVLVLIDSALDKVDVRDILDVLPSLPSKSLKHSLKTC